ncbi:hypothetical protein [Archaeoglobus veneficus]|uniref:Uncharacterized protein n=1 Tax=Archaeoglobus veneficus (strain DSM 11195 / SNP6) TaxID=693661 RepID=F2KS66_ARCVS|nr:hypothetical protein [Archaeoglobus veneficus]AEA48005.1 hypothetical protein Arcve_2012 [Archaeoglobus veneficus SNP6]
MLKEDIALTAIMVFSAVMLTYKWLSLYDRVDMAVIFFAFLLTLSLGALIISIELRMQKVMEEFESTKRTIALNADDLEDRIEAKLNAYLGYLEEKIERIEKRIYR